MNAKSIVLKNILLVLMIEFSYAQNNQAHSNDALSGEWNRVSEVPGGGNKILFTDSSNGWVIGNNGKIFATEDGGATWFPQNSGTGNNLLSICFVDERTGLVSGADKTLIRTNNKGFTWTPVGVESDSGGKFNSLSIDVNGNVSFINNYGEVFCSEDTGATWHRKHDFTGWGFSSLDWSNNPICFASKMMSDDLYKSIDGGQSWENYPLPSPWHGGLCFLDGHIGWVTEDWAASSTIHDSTAIYMTTDGGESWTKQSAFLNASEMSLYGINFLDQSTGWACRPGRIYHTADSGKSWTCQLEIEGFGYITDIFILNERNGWALTDQGKIFRYRADTEVSMDGSADNYPHDDILHNNYPNPFNSSTRITYTIRKPDYVDLTVLNPLGRKVRVLVHDRQNAGDHSVILNAGKLPSGNYIIRLKVGEDLIETRKMLLLK